MKSSVVNNQQRPIAM